jgi:hypothetical protein
MRRSSTARKPSNTTRLAAYGTLIAGAEKLGHDEVVRFLTTNFDEEKAAIKHHASEGRQHKGVERRLTLHRLPSLRRERDHAF